MTEIVDPSPDSLGYESHPAWALIGASRVSHSPPGKVLFDSDVRHQHYVVVRIREARRKRDLNRDWIHGDATIAEVALSEAQWASFVSSMNVGDGVPATLEWDGRKVDPRVPGMPYEPRLRESMDEVRSAASKAQADVLEAFLEYREHKTAGNLRTLQARIENMPANIAFAAESLTEHAENVVQRARADIEAFVVAKAEQLGLEPSDVAGTFELGSGGEES